MTLDMIFGASAVAPVRVATFFPLVAEEIPFTPALLLPVALPSVITGDAEYQEGCEYGFYHCLSEEDSSCWREVEREVVEGVVIAYEEFGTSVAWSAGFEHGLLSALALTRRDLAREGLDLLRVVVEAMQRETVRRALGADAWPLDL